jgi:hypothetical protein
MRRLLVLALAACSSSSAPKPAPAEQAPIPQAAPVAPVGSDTTQGVPGSQDLAGLNRVMSELQREQKDRPSVKVTAEKLFGALTDKGVKFASQKQVLATTAQAEYCALGVTEDNIGIAVCEYSSERAARDGKKLLDTHYAKLVPDAERRINGATLVTVANGRSHREVRDRVIETFLSL